MLHHGISWHRHPFSHYSDGVTPGTVTILVIIVTVNGTVIILFTIVTVLHHGISWPRHHFSHHSDVVWHRHHFIHYYDSATPHYYHGTVTILFTLVTVLHHGISWPRHHFKQYSTMAPSLFVLQSVTMVTVLSFLVLSFQFKLSNCLFRRGGCISTTCCAIYFFLIASHFLLCAMERGCICLNRGVAFAPRIRIELLYSRA